MDRDIVRETAQWPEHALGVTLKGTVENFRRHASNQQEFFRLSERRMQRAKRRSEGEIIPIELSEDAFRGRSAPVNDRSRDLNRTPALQAERREQAQQVLRRGLVDVQPRGLGQNFHIGLARGKEEVQPRGFRGEILRGAVLHPSVGVSCRLSMPAA